MLIGLMSDSHDNLENIRKAVQMLQKKAAGALIHAGDFVAPFAVKEILAFGPEVYGIFGNNDGERAGIAKLWKRVFCGPYLFELGGLRILAAHDEADLERNIYENVDVKVFGHSHKARIVEGRPLTVNPGETGGWLTGRSTCALLDTDKVEAKILEIR